MRKIILYLLFSSFLYSQNNGNVQNELGIKNTQIFYFDHQFIDPIENGKDFFKPYLSFLKENGAYENTLMDSFVLYDSYFINMFHNLFPKPYNGMYDQDDLNNYLDNIFRKTKLPIIKNMLGNNVGYIGNNENSVLIYPFDIEGNQELELKFNIVAPKLSSPTSWDGILIGLKFYNSDNEEILVEHEWLNMSYQAFGSISNIWQLKNFIIPVPNDSNINSAELFIFNHKLNMDSHILLDNVTLKNTNTGFNYINTDDSNFNSLPITSKWEFIKKYSKSKQFLFSNRTSILTDIKNANNELPIQQSIKIIPILPSINIDSLVHNSNFDDEIKIKIEDYIDEIEQRFNLWNYNNPNSNIEIVGLYFVDEGIKAGREFFLNPILQHTRTLLHNKGWKLFGSPYIDRKPQDCTIESSFHDSTINLFDITWQQPNAFFYEYPHLDPEGLGRDRELLRLTNDLAFSKNININIENRVLMSTLGEEYGRINDYFDYGDKYGYINYAKIYYDDAGAHYLNAHSNEQNERIDYDNLYKFIKKSRIGEIINGKFEILDETNNFKFHRWNGNYSIQNNLFSSSITNRKLKFLTNTLANYYSENIPISYGKTYNVSFKAKEIVNDQQPNSALVGVIFYDNDGNELTNLNLSDTNLQFSSYLSHYYIYFNTSTIYNNYSLFFKPPNGAVKFKFYLKKSNNANIEWKSIKFYEENKPDKSNLIYGDNTPHLKVEKSFDYGNYSLTLDNFTYAVTTEKVSVSNSNSTNYSFSVDVKEKLPLVSETQQNKALIAIETFDAEGTKITPPLNNLSYSSTLNMYYKYITGINQVWNNFNVQTQFPQNVASIKVYLYNWYYDNTLYVDNIKLSLTSKTSLDRYIDNNNLLSREKWNEKLPLVASYLNPVIYNDFINVCDIAQLEFSALMRNSSESNNNDLLSIEFFDKNYNVLLYEDIMSTNFDWSNIYSYWWKEYFDISSFECNQTIEWTQNQWEEYTRHIDIPDEAVYLRLSFHKLSSQDNNFLILNPKLIVSNYRDCEKFGFKNFNIISPREMYVDVSPNPTKKSFQVIFENDNTLNYKIFNIRGVLLMEGRVDNYESINIESISSGMYIISFYNGNFKETQKIIKY